MNSAFEQLYKVSSGRVYAVCFRILADKKEAEELTIKVYYTAWEQIKFFRPEITFAAWLTGITVFLTMEKLRARTPDYENTAVKNFPSLSPLEQAVLNLPSNERISVVLHDIEKYTIQETSDIMGSSIEAVRKLLNSAHKKLINEMKL